MRRLSFKDRALAFLSGILIVLCFPKYDLSLLVWVALILYLSAIQDKRSSEAFWLGWLTGGIYFLGTVNWVTITMERYGKLPVVISLLLMLLLVAYLGLYVGIFGFLIKKLSPPSAEPIRGHPLILTVLAPSIWVSLEFLRGHLLTGFPWVLLGYSQYRMLPVIQISDVTGVYAVSFLIVMVNVALYEGIRRFLTHRREAETMRPFLLAIGLPALLVLLSLGYGYRRIAGLPSDHRPLVK